jgi:diketogulonate reductase-like aldo/keto reductase
LRMATTGGGSRKVGMAAAQTASTILSHRNRPFLVYGTAWKKERTAEYVSQAIHAGFRFIDTACQPRHYNESGVGHGWTMAAKDLNLQRQDLFLQTKYSPAGGQDKKSIPYDIDAPYATQVRQSLAVSLQNLQTTYLDSLVLHSPMDSMEETMEVWREFEKLVDEGQVHRIGISNCYDYDTFTTLYEMARIKPSVLQNRLYAESDFDTKLREFIVQQNAKNAENRQHNKIWYQSFWTLTANRDALNHNAEIRDWASRLDLTPQQLMFAFLMSLPDGYLTPLSGTTSTEHMAHDVAIMERVQNAIGAGDHSPFFSSHEELVQFASLLGMPAL